MACHFHAVRDLMVASDVGCPRVAVRAAADTEGIQAAVDAITSVAVTVRTPR